MLISLLKGVQFAYKVFFISFALKSSKFNKDWVFNLLSNLAKNKKIKEIKK